MARLPGVSSAPPTPCRARARDEHRDVRREPAEQRRQREPDDADEEHPPPAEPVAERAAEQDQRGQGQRVAVDGPLQAGERRRRRSAPIAGSATLTTVPSSNAMPEPRTVARSTQRARGRPVGELVHRRPRPRGRAPARRRDTLRATTSSHVTAGGTARLWAAIRSRSAGIGRRAGERVREPGVRRSPAGPRRRPSTNSHDARTRRGPRPAARRRGPPARRCRTTRARTGADEDVGPAYSSRSSSAREPAGQLHPAEVVPVAGTAPSRARCGPSPATTARSRDRRRRGRRAPRAAPQQRQRPLARRQPHHGDDQHLVRRPRRRVDPPRRRVDAVRQHADLDASAAAGPHGPGGHLADRREHHRPRRPTARRGRRRATRVAASPSECTVTTSGHRGADQRRRGSARERRDDARRAAWTTSNPPARDHAQDLAAGPRVHGQLVRQVDGDAVHGDALDHLVRRPVVPGPGVAVTTSASCPAARCRRARPCTCISIPPSRGR